MISSMDNSTKSRSPYVLYLQCFCAAQHLNVTVLKFPRVFLGKWLGITKIDNLKILCIAFLILAYFCFVSEMRIYIISETL